MKDDSMIINLNHSHNTKSGKYYSLVKCSVCGKERLIDKYVAIFSEKKTGNLCKSCNGKRPKHNKKLSSHDYALMELKTGYIHLGDIPNLSIGKSLWGCNKCNNQWLVSFNKLAQGRRCPRCCGRYERTENDYRILGEKMGVTFIGPIPKRVDEKTNWLCKCGRRIKIDWQHVERGQNCKPCSILKRSGEKHPLFNSEISPIDRTRRRLIPEYRAWVKQTLEKFNFTCLKCKERGATLNAHHLFNWSSFPKLRYDINNAVCLCEKCHSLKFPNSFHRIYGTKNNTLQQIEEFIGRELAEINREELLNRVKESPV